MLSKVAGVILLTMLLGCGVMGAVGNEELPGEAFMNLARQRAVRQNSFGDLRGRVMHLQRNRGGAVYYPVRFLIRFSPQVINARLTINGVETHEFRQNLPGGKKVISNNLPEQQEALLNKLGFRIEDLMLSFLDYPVKAEQAVETIKTVRCRVLDLQSPEGERVRVWIASEYLFPLKARFYAADDKKYAVPLRTLEVAGFDKINNYYVATDIALFSKDFRTRIEFSDCQVVRSDDPRAVREFK